MPVITINTQDGAPVLDKENKIPALMDVSLPEGYATFAGTEAEALSGIELTIKGRGNASWKLDKKPYKIKFEKKTPLLGMPKHKHFALIPWAVGYAQWIACVSGHEMARMTGMGWAPRIEPVELVLNGSYDGLYFVVESMKIDKSRLDIYEQEDLCKDPELVKGGWLVEIDNYDDEAQIKIPETDRIDLRVTYKTPEVLSDIQRSWLIGQFTDMNEAIYSGDEIGRKWAEMIDPASVARYFIVREILGDTDGYNGSFYLHKDLGEGARWNFGPVWDLGFSPKSDWVMNDHPAYSQVHWIEPMFHTLMFRMALVDEWDKFEARFEEVFAHSERIAEMCREADRINYERWPQYEKGNTDAKLAFFKNKLRENKQWMDMQISDISAGVQEVSDASETAIFRINGPSIEFSAALGNIEVAVYSASGSLVRRFEAVGGSRSSLENLSAGIYVVTATSEGYRQQTAKVAVD